MPSTSSKVLIIEDDRKMSDALVSGIRSTGYAASTITINRLNRLHAKFRAHRLPAKDRPSVMTPIHQTVEFLLTGDARATAVADSLTESNSWMQVIAPARAWKVVPALSARIQSLRSRLPVEVTGTLRREFLRAYAQSAQRAAKTIAAIRHLEQAGISVAAFKGIASMAVLYDGPKHRTIGDGDLLLAKNDLPKALACLEAHGFARRGTETLTEYLGFVSNAPRFASNQALALYADDGGEIDLHWEITGSGLRVDEILQRSVPATLLGSTIPVVDSTDGFLLAVHHAIREDLAIESVCRDLLDIRLWCNHLEQAGQLEAGMNAAAKSGSQVAALAVTSLLSSYDDTTPAARAAECLRHLATPAQRRSAALLTQLFHYQISSGRLEKDVFFLVHSRPWRQIIKGLGTDWSGYRRSMQTLETHLGERQPLHKRFAHLVRSIPSPQALRLARVLARVKYRSH
jgi:hypothetical protein